MGRYDTMFLIEGPDDATIAKAALALGSLGNVQSETLPAFTEEEYRQLVAALP
ncbi:MAG TPA: GYD domain-containing protein [Candidatus Tectomicrobia bacterium]|nr:GYD domain-containing protein [Candidatus Tectomicrobia bacterium]